MQRLTKFIMPNFSHFRAMPSCSQESRVLL